MGSFKFAKTVLKSMFKKPITLQYPVVAKEWPEGMRGSVVIEDDKCILCGICSRKCPADAINVDRKEGKWEIHRMQCVQCGECVAECPKNCLTMDPKYTEPGAEKIIDTHDIEVKKPAPKAKDDAGDKEKKPDADAAAADSAAETSGDDDKLVCNLNECVFCGLCAKTCPCDALEVNRKEKVWKVDEDACVKCGACVEKCPKKCLSIGVAPEGEAEEAEAKPAEKSIPVVDEETCIYCNACANTCPSEAISAEMDDWKVNEDECVGCAACIDVCPAEALKMETVTVEQ